MNHRTGMEMEVHDQGTLQKSELSRFSFQRKIEKPRAWRYGSKFLKGQDGH